MSRCAQVSSSSLAMGRLSSPVLAIISINFVQFVKKNEFKAYFAAKSKYGLVVAGV